MTSFDLLSIQCFISVAELGSFTKASKKVSRTQSAVSQQIAKMEASLGTPLFLRGKELTLTPNGEIFLGYAKRIYALQREVLDRFHEPDISGNLRFGLPEDFATVFLSDVLMDFIKIHPRIFLNIECDFTLNLVDRFKKNDFDLVLVKMNRPQDLPYGVDVWSEPLEWVGNSTIFQKDDPVPLILSPPPCVYRARAIDSLEEEKIRWRLAFSSPSYSGTVAAVRAGMGITVLPRNMIPNDLTTIRSNAALPPLYDTHISILKSQEKNAAVNSLEKFLLDRMKK